MSSSKVIVEDYSDLYRPTWLKEVLVTDLDAVTDKIEELSSSLDWDSCIKRLSRLSRGMDKGSVKELPRQLDEASRLLFLEVGCSQLRFVPFLLGLGIKVCSKYFSRERLLESRAVLGLIVLIERGYNCKNILECF